GLSFLPGSVAAISGISLAIQSPANYGFEWWSSASNRVAYLYADAAGSLQLAPTANVVLPDGHGLGWGVTANQTSIGGS
ncbi:hypothetical protein, partial [Klebsiella aerogenes]|uniref:hypothetical protein n=1 Tax=Klebsiella aerogenes TaxID=548 RepID=UPI001954E168